MDRSTMRNRCFGLVLSVVILSLASWTEVPMVPVPMTLQSLAVLLVGAWGGLKWGPAAVGLWLSLAALGAPLLAGMEGGIAKFVGPTAGYIAAFPGAAALVGWAADGGGLRTFGRRFGVMLAAHVLILGLGFIGLQAHLGPASAWARGVQPFILGMVLKSLIAAVLVGAAKSR